MIKKYKIIIFLEFAVITIIAIIAVWLGLANIRIQDKVAYEISNSLYSIYTTLDASDEKVVVDDKELVILAALEEDISIYQSFCRKQEVEDLSELVYWTNRMLIEYRTAPNRQDKALKHLNQLHPYYKTICYNLDEELYPPDRVGLHQGLQELSKLMDSEDYQRLYSQMIEMIK